MCRIAGATPLRSQEPLLGDDIRVPPVCPQRGGTFNDGMGLIKLHKSSPPKSGFWSSQGKTLVPVLYIDCLSTFNIPKYFFSTHFDVFPLYLWGRSDLRSLEFFGLGASNRSWSSNIMKDLSKKHVFHSMATPLKFNNNRRSPLKNDATGRRSPFLLGIR